MWFIAEQFVVNSQLKKISAKKGTLYLRERLSQV
jgi:hypothetical protein